MTRYANGVAEALPGMAAKLLEISRRTVYYLPQPVSRADLALMRGIDEPHLRHPFMGAHMLRDQLARQGSRPSPSAPAT